MKVSHVIHDKVGEFLEFLFQLINHQVFTVAGLALNVTSNLSNLIGQQVRYAVHGSPPTRGPGKGWRNRLSFHFRMV